MRDFREEKPRSEFEERVVSIDRVSYTVAGGRRLRFRALVVIGNRQGKVGMGVAKAGEVASAVQKAVARAKKNLMEVPIIHDTIPHMVETKFGSAHVLLKPAPAGTSVIAGGSVRAVIELAGIKNILSKALGSQNKINNVRATLLALRQLRWQRPVVQKETPLAEATPATKPVAPVQELEKPQEHVAKKTAKNAPKTKKTGLKKPKKAGR